MMSTLIFILEILTDDSFLAETGRRGRLVFPGFPQRQHPGSESNDETSDKQQHAEF